MPAAKIDVYIDKILVNHFKSWQGPIGRSVSRLATQTKVLAAVEAPKRTGRLAASIKIKKMSGPRGISFQVYSTVPYADFMERGTLPHVIYPKQPGGRLVFFWPKVGHTVFLKSVKHPGTKAYHYLEKGLSKALSVWNKTG